MDFDKLAWRLASWLNRFTRWRSCYGASKSWPNVVNVFSAHRRRRLLIGGRLQATPEKGEAGALVGPLPVGVIQRDGYRIERLVLPGSDGEIVLPRLLFIPEPVEKSPILYLHGDGMKAEASLGGKIERLVNQGCVVLAAELSGIGETETGHGKRDYGRGRFGRDVQEIYLAYLIGRSFVGMRTNDVFRWSELLSRYESLDEPRQVELIAIGEAAIPALHAAAIEPARFESVRLRRMIRSWTEVVAAPVSHNQLGNVVHGALQHYDLPDLVNLAGRDRVTIAESVEVMGLVIED